MTDADEAKAHRGWQELQDWCAGNLSEKLTEQLNARVLAIIDAIAAPNTPDPRQGALFAALDEPDEQKLFPTSINHEPIPFWHNQAGSK